MEKVCANTIIIQYIQKKNPKNSILFYKQLNMVHACVLKMYKLFNVRQQSKRLYDGIYVPKYIKCLTMK